MTRTRFAFALAALGLAGPALAAELPTQSSLPSLAADPGTQAPDWKGFYVGTGVSVVSFKGEKGAVGGDVFAGYDRTFDNNLVLGVRFSTGYNPWLFPGGLYHGFDFAATSVKLGYEMGRLTPYVVTGVALARPTNFGGGLADPNNSINGLFAGPGALQAAGTAGVGFDYAITNNVHVGLEATVGNLGPYGAFGALGH
jgi:outer membrane immunogenic protein